MTTPGRTSDEPDSGYPRLESQIEWYDKKSGEAQWWYKKLKISEFIIGALVPPAALYDGKIGALLGALAIILEGIQQLNQWNHNWITYRSTCEALRHEKYSYLGRSSVYDGCDDSQAFKILVERTESLISTEHAKWISNQEYSVRKTFPKKAKGSGQS